MDEYTIRQAIDLIRARRFVDARKLLRPVLEVSPTNEAAWIWFASTFSGPAEKKQVYKAGLLFCTDSESLLRWVEKCEEEIQDLKAKGEEPIPVDITEELPQNAQQAKPKEKQVLLPEPGQTFEWNEPLLGRKKKESTTTGLFSVQSQAEVPLKAPEFENQPPDWMDSLRGTMSQEELDYRTREEEKASSRATGLLSRFPIASESDQAEPATETKITQKLGGLWNQIAGEDEPESPVIKETKPKVSFTRKLVQIWNRMGEETKESQSSNAKDKEPAETSFTPFASTQQSEDDVVLHPEFFETPQPEPEPEPYEEPVVIWGSQAISTDKQVTTVQPWELMGTAKTDEPGAAEPFPKTDISSMGDTVKTDESKDDPYKSPFDFALSLAFILGFLLLLILATNLI